ncbi:coiled-coil domain-containing protein 167 isoform X2 [Protopterus annectens]|uniref:coiled-coil domain-containing protein 167 isoform X2 n=1 Tax=Protopterus annectens TaxID=7888 RepID=UPI001CFC426A|nr:coiled-coil domain-containing protein 167 isoform X2 [Protopterus annectens]
MAKGKKHGFSVAREIDTVEEKLNVCRESLDHIDFKLRKHELTPEGRQSLEEEKSVLETRISRYEKELQQLRKANFKNMVLSVAVFLLFLLVYLYWTAEEN